MTRPSGEISHFEHGAGGARRRTNARNMQSASRTLVKSPPELWEMLDRPERMQGLMCALLGRATEVTVNQREPESILRWEASDAGADAWIEVDLAEKGWGTNVSLKAENGGEATRLEGWLDAVLEELATPQKRPFGGMGNAPPPERPLGETPVPESPEPGTPEPETSQTDEPERVEPEPGAPERVEPEPVGPQPAQAAAKPGRLRRFLGL